MIMMMDNAAELLSGSLGNGVLKTLVLGNRAYTVYAPTIYVISMMLKPLSRVDVSGIETKSGVIRVMPEQGKHIAMAVAVAVTGDVRFAKLKARRLYLKLLHSTPGDLYTAFRDIISLIQAQDFFDCATLAREVAVQMARPK